MLCCVVVYGVLVAQYYRNRRHPNILSCVGKRDREAVRVWWTLLGLTLKPHFGRSGSSIQSATTIMMVIYTKRDRHRFVLQRMSRWAAPSPAAKKWAGASQGRQGTEHRGVDSSTRTTPHLIAPGSSRRASFLFLLRLRWPRLSSLTGLSVALLPSSSSFFSLLRYLGAFFLRVSPRLIFFATPRGDCESIRYSISCELWDPLSVGLSEAHTPFLRVGRPSFALPFFFLFLFS